RRSDPALRERTCSSCFQNSRIRGGGCGNTKCAWLVDKACHMGLSSDVKAVVVMLVSAHHSWSMLGPDYLQRLKPGENSLTLHGGCQHSRGPSTWPHFSR